jgi:hypothetical protein
LKGLTFAETPLARSPDSSGTPEESALRPPFKAPHGFGFLVPRGFGALNPNEKGRL